MPYYTFGRAQATFVKELLRLRPDVIDDLRSLVGSAIRNDLDMRFQDVLCKYRSVELSLERDSPPFCIVLNQNEQIPVPLTVLEELIQAHVALWTDKWKLRTDWLVQWAKRIALSDQSVLSFPDYSESSMHMLVGDDIRWWNLSLDAPPVLKIEVPWYAGWFPYIGQPSEKVLAQIRAVENGVLEHRMRALRGKPSQTQREQFIDRALRKRLGAVLDGIGTVGDETLGAMLPTLGKELSPEQADLLVEEALRDHLDGVLLQYGVVPELADAYASGKAWSSWGPPRSGEGKTDARDRMKKTLLSVIDDMLTEYLDEVEGGAKVAEKHKLNHFEWLIRWLIPEKTKGEGQSFRQIGKEFSAHHNTVSKAVYALADLLDLRGG